MSTLLLLLAVRDDEHDPVTENAKEKGVNTQNQSSVASPSNPGPGSSRRCLVCHPQRPQRSHLLRRISRQLQAYRA